MSYNRRFRRREFLVPISAEGRAEVGAKFQEGHLVFGHPSQEKLVLLHRRWSRRGLRLFIDTGKNVRGQESQSTYCPKTSF